MNKEIEQFIAGNADWYVEDEKLVAGFEFTSYDAVKKMVTEIIRLAGEYNHHPEVTFTFSTVEVKSTTHDQNNSITEKDLKLAEAISNYFSKGVYWGM